MDLTDEERKKFHVFIYPIMAPFIAQAKDYADQAAASAQRADSMQCMAQQILDDIRETIKGLKP